MYLLNVYYYRSEKYVNHRHSFIPHLSYIQSTILPLNHYTICFSACPSFLHLSTLPFVYTAIAHYTISLSIYSPVHISFHLFSHPPIPSFIYPSILSCIHLPYCKQGSRPEGFPPGPEAYWWRHGVIHNAFLPKGGLSGRVRIWSLCIHTHKLMHMDKYSQRDTHAHKESQKSLWFRSIMDFRTGLWTQCGSDLSTWDATITREQTVQIFK